MFIQHQPVEEYLDALEKEIVMTMNQYPSTKLQSIFVGGGTPTALTEHQLEKLTNIIKNQLSIHDQTEFTFEANPGDLSIEKYHLLKNAGVNRLSFGVQTFNDELLKKIGRTHCARDVFQTIELAEKTGFTNLSIDLIYGLPGQTLNDFSASVTTAVSLPIKHLSSYSLIVEPKTVFYNLMQKGRLPLPDEDIEAEMYELLMNEMEATGWKQYEISNFSLPGFESKHNLTYWDNENYYGFGAGAHSYLNGGRRANVAPLKKYMNMVNDDDFPILENHLVSKQEQMEEELFLGLRKTAGVSIRQFSEKYSENLLDLFSKEIDTHMKRGLINITENHLHLTKKGRFLGNEVFQSFIGII